MSTAMLPSDEWLLVPLHWHAYTHLPKPNSPPETALHHPAAVATWLAQHSTATLWHQHFLIASRGDSIRHDHLLAKAILNEKCTHHCPRHPAMTRAGS